MTRMLLDEIELHFIRIQEELQLQVGPVLQLIQQVSKNVFLAGVNKQRKVTK